MSEAIEPHLGPGGWVRFDDPEVGVPVWARYRHRRFDPRGGGPPHYSATPVDLFISNDRGVTGNILRKLQFFRMDQLASVNAPELLRRLDDSAPDLRALLHQTELEPGELLRWRA